MSSPKPDLPTITALALFKNEAMNMEEFIRHHVEEGVSEFVLINDGSTDNGVVIAERVANELNVDLTIIPVSISAYHRILYTIHSRITKFFSLLRLRIPTFPASVRQIKQTIYTNALPLVTKDWLMRVDMDEFWFVEKGDIPEYLAGLPEDATSVQVVWQMFCSNGAFLKHPNSLINAYIETTATAGAGRKRRGAADPARPSPRHRRLSVSGAIRSRQGREESWSSRPQNLKPIFRVCDSITTVLKARTTSLRYRFPEPSRTHFFEGRH